MSFTPQQQYQLLLSVIEEAQRLAQKFGLNDGLVMLEEFKKSLENLNNTHSLANVIDQEKVFPKVYKEKRLQLSQLIANIFGYDLSSRKPHQDLKKILSPTDKELKKITTENDGIFDFNKVIDYVKDNVRDHIKIKFGMAKTDISGARSILEKILMGSPEEITKVTELIRIFQRAVKDKKPLNHKFYTISINGLSKLIKIINGIQNESLAKACVSFFTNDTAENQLIIKAFFAAEKTEQYCRNSSLLVQILAELVNQDPECNKIVDSLVKGILTRSKETSIEALMTHKNNSANEVFIELFMAVLNTAVHFNFILDLVMQDLSNRDPKISQLQASKDVFLKSAFYFGLISPLLANIEGKLEKEWPAQACQKFRLELSIGFDIMLGLKSADKIAQIKSRGVIYPALFDLVTSPLMLETVERTFTTLGKSEEDVADLPEIVSPRGITSRKSPPINDHQDKASSSAPAPLTEAFGKNRTIIFFHGLNASSSSEGPTQITSTSPRAPIPKVTSARATSAVPKASISISDIIQRENTLERFFNDLFACDTEKATQFVLSLVRNKDINKFSWAIRVLNEAFDKTNKQIADVLINNLTQTELMSVFDVLFREEKSDSWCRGNNLLPGLIQQYMAHNDAREFKDFIWNALFPLEKPISCIKVAQENSLEMIPDRFTAKPGDITLVQEKFSVVMMNMLSPKNFPPLVQKILCLAYLDLLQREDINNDDNNRMRTFLGFILLRFINPIIYQEAKSHAMDENLKIWFLKILPTAVQSLSSLLNLKTPSPDEEITLQDAMFSPITKDRNFREQLFSMISKELALDDVSKEKRPDPLSSGTLDIPASIKELGDMLKVDFSGLSFKTNGSVITPRRDEQKPHVTSFFQIPSDTDNQNPSQAASLTSVSGNSKHM